MGCTNHFAAIFFLLFLLIVSNNSPCQAHELSARFYDSKCPHALSKIRNKIRTHVHFDRRMAASLIRLQFHDCFVLGCDASILLNDAPNLKSEKNASPNSDSLRGYDVIEAAKYEVEKLCPGVVSCADIIVLAARDASEAVGGPSWSVKLGRRDSTNASIDLAEDNLPGAEDSLDSLIANFNKQGLTTRDLVVLAGAHTIGQAQCKFFRSRLYDNRSDIDAGFAQYRRIGCPLNSGDSNWAPLDVSTPERFDNNYFKNLIQKKGLLESDQVLVSVDETEKIVSEYSNNPFRFQNDFAVAMVKMSGINPLTGKEGVIRKKCSALP